MPCQGRLCPGAVARGAPEDKCVSAAADGQSLTELTHARDTAIISTVALRCPHPAIRDTAHRRAPGLTVVVTAACTLRLLRHDFFDRAEPRATLVADALRLHPAGFHTSRKPGVALAAHVRVTSGGGPAAFARESLQLFTALYRDALIRAGADPEGVTRTWGAFRLLTSRIHAWRTGRARRRATCIVVDHFARACLAVCDRRRSSSAVRSRWAESSAKAISDFRGVPTNCAWRARGSTPSIQVRLPRWAALA